MSRRTARARSAALLGLGPGPPAEDDPDRMPRQQSVGWFDLLCHLLSALGLLFDLLLDLAVAVGHHLRSHVSLRCAFLQLIL